jgi:hypothetical protein
VYVWDIHTIIKNAGLEILPSIPGVSVNTAPTLPH